VQKRITVCNNGDGCQVSCQQLRADVDLPKKKCLLAAQTKIPEPKTSLNWICRAICMPTSLLSA